MKRDRVKEGRRGERDTQKEERDRKKDGEMKRRIEAGRNKRRME